MVVFFQGATNAYGRNGYRVNSFPSMLPGGNRHHKGRYKGTQSVYAISITAKTQNTTASSFMILAGTAKTVRWPFELNKPLCGISSKSTGPLFVKLNRKELVTLYQKMP